ncbi:hypothetical protein [Streptomyces mayteni]
MAEEGSAADFAMDYEKLYAMQRGLHALAEKADTGGGNGVWEEVGSETASANESVFGNYDLAYQFQLFYGKSKVRIDEGKDKLERFGDMFGGVADALFQQDAQIAATAATDAANSLFDNWKQEKLAVEEWERRNDEWNDYLREIGADEYFRENPEDNIWEVCSREDSPDWCQTWKDDYPKEPDDHRPAPPGERPPDPELELPPTHIQFGDDDGAKTEVWVTYDEDYNIIEEKSTVVTADGEEYTTTIEYDGPPDYSEPDENGDSFDRRGYTITTTGPDGTETVEEVEVEDDGSGTTSEGTAEFTNDDDRETETVETETVKNDDGGQTTTTTTTDKDGNEETTVTELVLHDDGSQTRTVTTTDADGETDTDTYHRDDWLGTWELDEEDQNERDVEPGADGADGDNNGVDYPTDSWTGPKL